MIRPIDLQNTLLAAQSAAAGPRTEPGLRVDAQAVAAVLVAQRRELEQDIAPAGEIDGNRVGTKDSDGDGESTGSRRRGRRRRNPASDFEAIVEEGAGSSEEPSHIVDFTA